MEVKSHRWSHGKLEFKIEMESLGDKAKFPDTEEFSPVCAALIDFIDDREGFEDQNMVLDYAKDLIQDATEKDLVMKAIASAFASKEGSRLRKRHPTFTHVAQPSPPAIMGEQEDGSNRECGFEHDDPFDAAKFEAVVYSCYFKKGDKLGFLYGLPCSTCSKVLKGAIGKEVYVCRTLMKTGGQSCCKAKGAGGLCCKSCALAQASSRSSNIRKRRQAAN